LTKDIYIDAFSLLIAMDGIFGRKKMKMPFKEPVSRNSIDCNSEQIINNFKELNKSIKPEKSFSQDSYYCPDCGKEYNIKVDVCEDCGRIIKFSDYGAKNEINPNSTIEDYLFFSPGTKEYFAYGAANNIINLYKMNIENDYLDVSNELLSLRTNMELLENPLGVLKSLENTIKSMNITPDNLSLAKNINESSFENIVNLSKNLIKSFYEYLAKNESKNVSYSKIMEYMKNNAEKSLMD
jgi:predicted RNA-binding Zn-ribbon protein involved in translation (DUF1610 family)